MYDARGGGNVCGVTFFMDDSDHNTREQTTTLHVLYANANAAGYSGSLRNATFKSTNHYTVQIQHPEPQDFFKGLVTVKTGGEGFSEIVEWAKKVAPITSEASTPEKKEQNRMEDAYMPHKPSSPPEGQQSGGINSFSKKGPCRYFNNGGCVWGNKCWFSH